VNDDPSYDVVQQDNWQLVLKYILMNKRQQEHTDGDFNFKYFCFS